MSGILVLVFVLATHCGGLLLERPVQGGRDDFWLIARELLKEINKRHRGQP
jgi:hypothetical protein